MVISSETSHYEYPLKVVEMDDFLYSSDDLLWRSVSKTSQGLYKVKHRINNESHDKLNIRLSDFNDDDFYTNTSKIPRNLTDSTQITLVFTDSELYKQNFEKTHLKLINNMIVLDSNINLNTIEEARRFYDLLLNSKRWLFHGQVKLKDDCYNKDTRPKAKFNKFTLQNRNARDDEKLTDILLILNTTDNYVRDKLISGFKRLIKSFSTHTRSLLEINFRKSLQVFYVRKMNRANTNAHNYEIRKSSVTFRTNPSYISTLLNNSNQSFSSLSSVNRQKKLGVFFNRVKNVLVQKVQKVSHSSPIIHTKFSFEVLPHLLCFLDENKSKVLYTSHSDDKFFSIGNEKDNYDHLRRPFGLKKCEDDLNEPILSKKNSSGSDWSSSVNSSFTGYSSSKSFDCLTEKYFSSYETDFDVELDKEKKFHNRSLYDINQNPESKSSKSMFVKNVTVTRQKSNKATNENSSINSSLSSISNYLIKKKRLSGSSDAASSEESVRLLESEILNSLSNGTVDKNSSLIKIDENDFRRSKKEVLKKTSSNSDNYDELINRHPALVRTALRSKSADLISDRTPVKKTILKTRVENHQNPVNLDYEEIEEATKKNTFLNGQLFQSQIIESHSSRKNDTSGSKTKIYQQNSRTMYESCETLDGSKKTKRSSSKTSTYAKCCSKQNPKKSYSPPPPVYISPTGLLPPPPQPLQKLTNTEILDDKENFENKKRFNEIRSRFEIESRLNSVSRPHVIKHTQSQKNLTQKNLVLNNNYNHLSFKGNSYL